MIGSITDRLNDTGQLGLRVRDYLVSIDGIDVAHADVPTVLTVFGEAGPTIELVVIRVANDGYSTLPVRSTREPPATASYDVLGPSGVGSGRAGGKPVTQPGGGARRPYYSEIDSGDGDDGDGDGGGTVGAGHTPPVGPAPPPHAGPRGVRSAAADPGR